MFKSIIYILAAAGSIFAQQEEGDKIEAGCKPCAQACPDRCPESTALAAAYMLISNLGVYTNNDDLGMIQSIVNIKSTIQTTIDTGSGCSESQVMPFLNGYTPLLAILSNAGGANVLSSYVDNKGRVIVTTEENVTVNSVPKVYKNRYTFQACNGLCGFSLVDLVMRDEACIAA